MSTTTIPRDCATIELQLAKNHSLLFAEMRRFRLCALTLAGAARGWQAKLAVAIMLFLVVSTPRPADILIR